MTFANFMIALICLAIVCMFIEFAISVFVCWLIFLAISGILGLFGLQRYAWLVFAVFVIWSWLFGRY
jgi:hypothetical protein